MKYLICHYSEIGLKGKNRRFFEERLIFNIKKVLKRDWFSFVKRIPGRILIRLTEKGQKNQKEISEKLKNVFGIAFFSFAVETDAKIEKIKEKAFELLKGEKFKTFKIETQRSDKTFPLTSQEVNERVGEHILKKSKIKNQKSKIKVKLKNPDIICFIEIVEKKAFLYLEKIKGPGGLPISTGGKAISLLSGGIDSPVAAFFVAKRGIEIIFVHFHAYPYTKKQSIEKAIKITRLFKKYQPRISLYLVPFGEIQKEIFLKTLAKIRMILYRRVMLKIAEIIAKKEKALALITGESIGQVASQTLENIKVIEEAIKLPIFRPLVGFDKEEIIKKAKEIETFEISILPYEDCCSRFLPKHPETKAKIEEIKKAEKKIPLKFLITEALKETEIKKI
jgi:thiamine biosynthesis protein ThiI